MGDTEDRNFSFSAILKRIIDLQETEEKSSGTRHSNEDRDRLKNFSFFFAKTADTSRGYS